MGSIGLRDDTAGWTYRASKAALNSVLKDASIALAGRALCVAFHPGWVRTDMGGASADLDAAESVAGMRRALAALDAARNGSFLNHDGSRWPGRRSHDNDTRDNHDLSEDHRAVQDAVRAFVRERIAPRAAAWEQESRFPKRGVGGPGRPRLLRRGGPRRMGRGGPGLPVAALDPRGDRRRRRRHLDRRSVNNCPVYTIMMAFANESQKARFLRPLARGELLGAFCLTEPHVGSEAGGLRTTASKDGDGWVIDGVKQFITSGKNGDLAIVMAVTDKAAGKQGISAFVVPTAPPATSSPGSKRRWASTRATPRRSCSKTAACRRTTASGKKARA